MSELGTVDHKNNTLPDKSRHIVITGASGEIGGALALAYAGPGVLLTLCGRKENKLVLVKKSVTSRKGLLANGELHQY